MPVFYFHLDECIPHLTMRGLTWPIWRMQFHSRSRSPPGRNSYWPGFPEEVRMRAFTIVVVALLSLLSARLHKISKKFPACPRFRSRSTRRSRRCLTNTVPWAAPL
jgi:hypothetical protein